tara:strand:+ start:116 stop:379 length:264 start_codon:yes stop_codon:yes gene_type:complete
MQKSMSRAGCSLHFPICYIEFLFVKGLETDKVNQQFFNDPVAENFDIFHIKLCVPPTRLTIITLKIAFEGVLFINVKKCDLWYSNTL